MVSKKHIVWLMMICVVGLLLRLHNLSGRSLWMDEFFTLFEAGGHGIAIDRLIQGMYQSPQPTLITAGELKQFLRFDRAKTVGDVTWSVLKTDTHPPLYYVLIHFWMRAFGDSALAVRWFSVLAGVLSIIAAYLVSRVLFDEGTGLATALFVSISGFAVRFSQEARSYALILLIGFVSWWLLLRLRRSNRISDLLLLSLANACGLYAHYFFVFIVIAEFFYMTVALRRDPRRLDTFYLSHLLCLLFFMPWVGKIILHRYNFHLVEWIMGYPGLLNKLFYLFIGPGRFIALSGMPQTRASFPFLFMPTLLWVYLIGTASKGLLRSKPGSLAWCSVMTIVPLGAMLFLDIVQHGALLRQERFWAFVFIGCCPLIGYALGTLLAVRKKIGILFILALAVFSWFAAETQFGPAPKAAAAWVANAARGKKAAVLIYNLRSVLFTQVYYLPNDIILAPVSNENQLIQAQAKARTFADILFVVRHYHPSGPLLTDNACMAYDLRTQGLCVKDAFHEDDISVVEYVRCAS